MTRCTAAMLLFVGFALMAQLSAAVFHEPQDVACSSEAASAEPQDEHQEEIVAAVEPLAEGLAVRRHHAVDWSAPPRIRADEILHVPRA